MLNLRKIRLEFMYKETEKIPLEKGIQFAQNGVK